VEVVKYPYCVKSIESIESEKFLLDKICRWTIQIRKKSVRKTKWLIVYGNFILRLTNGAVPSQANNRFGLPILPTTPPMKNL
jgi:hypothetical protein